MKKAINTTWFWTERWQQGEREAGDDICAGRVKSFPDVKSAINYLQGYKL